MIDLAVVRPLYGLEPDLGIALRRLSHRPALSELLHYQPNAGMRRHRSAGAQWASRYGIDVDDGRVIVCSGTQHALTVTLTSLCASGDTLLVEELTYPGIRALANLLELKTVPLPMDESGLVPEALEAACRQRRPKALFIMPTIHNPRTVTIPEERRRAIAAIAARYDVAIVEDTVNHLLADNPPPPLSLYAPEVGYFIASLSKAVTGGLRVAYLIGPENVVDTLTKAVWATNWMTAPLCAEIAAAWIEDGTADAACSRKKAEAGRRVSAARDILGEFDLRSDDYGHHAWLNLPECWQSAMQFAEEARRAGVAVAPADVFSVGGVAPLAVRLALSTPRNIETLSRGLAKLKRLLGGPPGLGAAIL
jgi:DNA-binding transcriptional MocR family regulator